MKLIIKFSRDAFRYKRLYAAAIISALSLTLINLTAPRLLSGMTGFVGSGMTQADLNQIKILTLELLLLYLLRILFRFLSNYQAHKAAWLLVGDLRTKIYNKLQSLDLGFFTDQQTGDLMSRVVNDTREFELLYAHIIPEMLINLVTFFGVLSILLTINWRLAALTCIPIPFIVFSGIIFAKKVRPYFQNSQRAVGELNAKLQDNLAGMHEIQSFVRENDESNRMQEKIFAQVNTMLLALKAGAVFHPFVEFLSSVGMVIVVGAGGVLAFRAQLSVSDIVAFLLYLSLFYAPVSGLSQLLENAQQALAGAERVMLILDTPVKIEEQEGAIDAGALKGRLDFEDVSFSYQQDLPVLRHITFHCEPGQMVALVGPTGVGKTTLTQLIPRFYEPDSGVIRIDGIDIRTMTKASLRSNISPVLQETFLFSGTILENIRYARPEATREEIIAASKAAYIHEDILTMPAQYDSEVGERGIRLSVGQKQRVAIARAILRNSPIVILDEATASVDLETERKIQEAVNQLAGSRTIVAVAHRLSTIRHANLILVIEEGGIVESGTHEQLLAKHGYYWKMNQIQNPV
ncbi:MAG: ABC transporter ATP-binding protein/permease [Negativicutes bacterium]|nr:ABC transporter ATP-binding protein/permease [Negativicutes bacterium]